MKRLALLVAVAACSSSSASKPKPAPDAQVPAGPPVAIRVDGADVTSVRSSDLHGKVALASLLPEAQRDGWRGVRATAGKRSLMLDPFEDYADLEVVVEASGSEVALSVYRPVPPDAPAHVAAELAKPRLSMGGIEAIDISRTAPSDDEMAAAPAFAPFTVTVGAATRTIYPNDLEPLEQVSASDKGERKKREGWNLADVLALVAPGKTIAEVTVTGEDTQTFVPGKDLVILRPNRRGLLGLHVFHDGQRVLHVRAVASITAKEK